MKNDAPIRSAASVAAEETFKQMIREWGRKISQVEDDIIYNADSNEGYRRRLTIYRQYIKAQFWHGAYLTRNFRRLNIAFQPVIEYYHNVVEKNQLINALSMYKSSSALAEELNSAFEKLGFNLKVEFADASQKTLGVDSSASSLWMDRQADPPPQRRISATEISQQVDRNAKRLAEKFHEEEPNNGVYDASHLLLPKIEADEVVSRLKSNNDSGPKANRNIA